MTEFDRGDWSPADNPYAIAVSEAQWWLQTVGLTIQRLHDEDDSRVAFSSRQIDARTLVHALQQLAAAERLEQTALSALDIDPRVRGHLAQARKNFENALPGLRHMRDAVIHFDEWAIGRGKGPQQARIRAGVEPRDVAREFWGFGYDPLADTVSMGPYVIDVAKAGPAAMTLSYAIYMAAHDVDLSNAAKLRDRTIHALTVAGISIGHPDGTIGVSAGTDTRVWVSLRGQQDFNEDDRLTIASAVVDALAITGLRLISAMHPQDRNAAARLSAFEPLCVEPHATADAASPEVESGTDLEGEQS